MAIDLSEVEQPVKQRRQPGDVLQVEDDIPVDVVLDCSNRSSRYKYKRQTIKTLTKDIMNNIVGQPIKLRAEITRWQHCHNIPVTFIFRFILIRISHQ